MSPSLSLRRRTEGIQIQTTEESCIIICKWWTSFFVLGRWSHVHFQTFIFYRRLSPYKIWICVHIYMYQIGRIPSWRSFFYILIFYFLYLGEVVVVVVFILISYYKFLLNKIFKWLLFIFGGGGVLLVKRLQYFYYSQDVVWQTCAWILWRKPS